ncbi:amino acid adenylation domain-containing protein [Streptomyces yaanensis]|uniref:Amino acid adenylation domain-containing protein n=1 Tax=Streptomyces yaanensis TaxID=1142239 RepID=A0ABV7SDC2_9ACTN|nr:amino acid adenylation domain-containing protein [Streptomyces sp. CGMCC 4.7035]WNB98245.1 amino acid adenylation domain-containing protein [Streptomyces sp. CGMCC 4.7035]
MRPDPKWTAGRRNTAPGEGLHEAFARRAAQRPGAVALVEGDRTTTYAELDATADAWAAGLVAAGVTPGALVPVLLPRSTELVTALLAVLKAGAAYALLAPEWPADRLREVLRDLRPPLLIARDGREVLEGDAPAVWLPPSAVAEESAVPVGFTPVAVGADDPACVFFTSGTTGRPKGVLSPHRATARLFQPGTFAEFTADTVMPLAAATPWDAFSLELWSVLLNGGTSVVVTDPYLSPAALSGAVSRHRADTVWLTASLFNMIVDEDPDAFLGLRQVAIGGERLSAGHVRRFLRRHPCIALLNGYGPVESTVFATTHRVTEADCDLPAGIPLGRPVPGTQVHVLDGSRPCAVGETGEICLAGDGLALGYLNDDALTALKFTGVRIDGREVRVYRTGDLGRWDPDGLLHYEGRSDRQLKIRGHRVEPAEVERQVERLLPAVRYCRVLARGDAARGERELVACCVPVRQGDPLDGALAVLNGALVAYQRPAAVVSVDAFPVTAQGKLDERALLALAEAAGPAAPGCPQREAAHPAGPGVRPTELSDPVLRAVAECFASVLELDAVPLDVPFVHLGGTSLGAGRLCARLAAALSRPVPISWLYQEPTASGLARRLAAAPEPTPPPADHAESEGSAGTPLSAMQLVYLTPQLLDPADRTGHCLMTWAVEGALDRAALEAAVAEVHRGHESLRAAYVLDPRPAAELVDIPPPPVEVLPARESVAAAARAARAELAAELAPDVGEVWRTVLVPVTGPEPEASAAVFGCVVHHVAFDGWSEGVLAEDLSTAYRTAVASGTPTLGPRPTLAAVHRERRALLREAATETHHAFLRSELADVPAMRWPVGPEPRKAKTPGLVETVLDAGALAGADAAAAAAGVTRFVVLLSLWAASLSEATGQRDFAVGVPVAQRDGAELERAVGCHINMLALRLRGAALDGDASAVARVAETTARAFAAQEVPFPDVLSLVEPPRGGRPPLYQVLFACQDNVPPRLELVGARTTLLRQPYLDLPLELHTELWPADDGGLLVHTAFRPDAVAESTAREVSKRFAERVRTLFPGVTP